MSVGLFNTEAIEGLNFSGDKNYEARQVVEKIAELHFGGDVDAAHKALDEIRGKLSSDYMAAASSPGGFEMAAGYFQGQQDLKREM